MKARAVFYGLGDYDMALAARQGYTLGSEDEYSGDELEFSEDGDDLSHDESSGDEDSEGRGCESEAESTDEGSDGDSDGDSDGSISDEESDADEGAEDSSEQEEGSGEPIAPPSFSIPLHRLPEFS